MANIRIPCLVAKTNKAGVTSWYWQPSATLAKGGWTPLKLGTDPDAASTAALRRNREVEEWKLGGSAEQHATVKARIQQGTVGALADLYRRDHINGTHLTTGLPLLAPGTRKIYEIALRRVEAWAGTHPLGYVTPKRIRALRDATAKPRDQGGLGHPAALAMLKMVRQIFDYAEQEEIIPKGSNPATKFGLGPAPSRSQLWEENHEAAFIAAAYDLGLPSMALAIKLAVWTGQREEDLIGFTAPQLQPLEIHNPLVRERFAGKDGTVKGWVMAQGKTSNRHTGVKVALQIAFEPELVAWIEKAIRENRARDRAAEETRLLTYVLVNDRNGLPWRLRTFIDNWKAIATHAAKATGLVEMNDLNWHDLRRTLVVRMRRQGTAKEMIAAVTGHSLGAIENMLKVYGPVDPTITAAALASRLDPLPAKADDAGEQSASVLPFVSPKRC